MREKVNDVTKTDYVLDSGFGSIFFFLMVSKDGIWRWETIEVAHKVNKMISLYLPMCIRGFIFKNSLVFRYVSSKWHLMDENA